jgi:hypothetical protein
VDGLVAHADDSISISADELDDQPYQSMICSRLVACSMLFFGL